MQRRVSEIFFSPTAIVIPPVDLGGAYDAKRRQHDSSELLRELLNQKPFWSSIIVGVTDVDLYSSILNFVFGEAQFNGSAAIVSCRRLRDTFYGLPDNPVRVLDRLEKEVVHEIGHVVGLTHCPDYRCVMHASACVEEIDLKTVVFCRGCEVELRRYQPVLSARGM